jgi:membrane carboxypeptidase/penicillin-binding protein
VWVGFDDGRSIGLSGSRAALPIFARFLVSSIGRYGTEEFQRPPGLDIVEIDAQSGLRAGGGCRGDAELFLWGTAPEGSCTRSRIAGTWRELSSRVYREVSPLIEELRRRLNRGHR